jgi:hypothetical protein
MFDLPSRRWKPLLQSLLHRIQDEGLTEMTMVNLTPWLNPGKTHCELDREPLKLDFGFSMKEACRVGWNQQKWKKDEEATPRIRQECDAELNRQPNPRSPSAAREGLKNFVSAHFVPFVRPLKSSSDKE